MTSNFIGFCTIVVPYNLRYVNGNVARYTGDIMWSPGLSLCISTSSLPIIIEI